jgi:ribosome biogenesis GTPase
LPTVDFANLGWDAARAEAFRPHADAGLVPGRVSLEHNHVYRVLTEEGEYLAESAGRIKHEAEDRRDLPVVGDWVALRPDERGGRQQIRAVLPRRSWFSRKVAGREAREQILAANVDIVFLVAGLDTPIKPRSIERYLLLARQSGASAVVVLNKGDACEAAADAKGDAEVVAAGAPVVVVSAKTGLGMAELRDLLQFGRTVALLGPSGAGKSTLVNRLIGEDRLETGDVRDWDARGRHTSVHRQMLIVPPAGSAGQEERAGGVLIDTPGLRELQLWDAADALGDTFADIEALAPHCRFRDCRHDREPGCAVRAAVEAGAFDPARLEGFLKLERERAVLASQREEREREGPRRKR